MNFPNIHKNQAISIMLLNRVKNELLFCRSLDHEYSTDKEEEIKFTANTTITI